MEVWLEARCVLEKLNIFIFIVRVESLVQLSAPVIFSQRDRDMTNNTKLRPGRRQTLLPDDFSLLSDQR